MFGRFAASESWIRAAEHGILRAVSLVFSMASAYAIRLFFAPLDAVDSGERVITWLIAIGFGVLGYVVSRGLVHRMMNKETIWAYAPICFLVELVDISCNYVLAASVVHQAWWLALVPANQSGILTFITYVVLSAIPLVSMFLAVVDMDLERSKKGGGTVATGRPVVRQAASAAARASQMASASAANVASATAAKRAQYWGNQQTQRGGSARNLMDDPEKDLAAAGIP